MTEEQRTRLTRLSDFCGVFEAEGFSMGEWGGGEETAPGLSSFPYCTLSAAAATFIGLCNKDGWVVPGFDWMSWMASPEGTGLCNDPEKMAEASPEQLSKLLTALVRRERFCDGSWESAHRSGLLLGIVRRARVLAYG